MSITRVAIKTAEDRYPIHPLDELGNPRHIGATAVERHVEEHWGPMKFAPIQQRAKLFPKTIANVPPLMAFVNHGRWLVQCPFCQSAMLATPKDLRFFCTESSCQNIEVQGAWRPYVFPEDWEQISEILGMRPHPHTRNWRHPETLEDLIAENEKNGVQ